MRSNVVVLLSVLAFVWFAPYKAAAKIDASSMCGSEEAFDVCAGKPEVKELIRSLSAVQTLGLQKADKDKKRLEHCSNISLMASGFMELQSAHFKFGEYVAALATKDAYDYAWKVETNNIDALPSLYSADVMRGYLKDPARLQQEWTSCLSEAKKSIEANLAKGE